MVYERKAKVIRRRQTKSFRLTIARVGDKIHITGIFPYPLLKPLLIIISILLVLSATLPGDTLPHLFL